MRKITLILNLIGVSACIGFASYMALVFYFFFTYGRVILYESNLTITIIGFTIGVLTTGYGFYLISLFIKAYGESRG